MSASSVEVVANDGIAIVRRSRIGDRSVRFHAEDALPFRPPQDDGVIDGRVAYVEQERHRGPLRRRTVADVVCRVTSPIVSRSRLRVPHGLRAKRSRPEAADLVGLFLDDVVTASLPSPTSA